MAAKDKPAQGMSKGRIVLIVVGGLILLSAIGNAMGGKTTGDTSTPDPTNDASPTQDTNGEQVGTVGTVVTVDGLEITLLTAEVNAGSEIFPPKAGFTYLGLQFKVRAVNGDQLLSSGSFDAAASDGLQYKSAFISGVDSWKPELLFEDIKAGQYVEGWVVYEIKPGVPFSVTFDNSTFDSNVNVRWNFSGN
jgi:hypothetical protein